MQQPYILARQTDHDGVERIELAEGGSLLWIPAFVPVARSRALFQTLSRDLQWQQSTITVYGRKVLIPRLNAWYGDSGCDYGYSGKRFVAQAWTPALDALRRDVNERLALSVNSVLANFYRDGSDSMGWHSDDEPELGDSPCIASLSLGGARRFLLRPRADRNAANQLEFELSEGSLLVMSGSVQRNWKHSVPRTRKAVAPRINLTFRRVIRRRNACDDAE